MTMSTIAVLGGGSMGTALAHAATLGGQRCTLWCETESAARAINEERRHQRLFPGVALAEGLRATTQLNEAIEGADLVVCAVRSTQMEELAASLASTIRPDATILSATKGIALGSLRRMSEVIAASSGAPSVGAIAGPNITHEIVAGKRSAIVVAATSIAIATSAAARLAAPHLVTQPSDDLVGIEGFSIFKNVVAIGASIAAGCGLGFNAQGMLIAAGIAEISRLVVRMGGRADSFWGFGGISDLYLTIMSPDSLNRRLGLEVGAGRPLEAVLAELPELPEGVAAVRGCVAMGRVLQVSVPFAEAVLDVLEGRAPPRSVEHVATPV